MKVSDLMKAMADAGAPMEAILVAVQALEAKDAEIAARDAKVAEKRAKDAARKREERDAARNVHGQSTDADGTVQDDPSLSPSPNEINSNPHPHTHPDRDTPRARKADPFPKPDWAEAQHWADLKANRKAKRLPNTATAHAKLLRDIENLADDAWPPGRLLEAIVARGWAAAYDPRESSKNDRKSPRHDEPQNAYVRAALAGQSRREAERTGAEFG